MFRSERLTVFDAYEMQSERIAYDQKISREVPTKVAETAHNEQYEQ